VASGLRIVLEGAAVMAERAVVQKLELANAQW